MWSDESYSPDLSVAAIFRLLDGSHQASVLKPVARAFRLQSYALLGFALRSFDYRSDFPISSMADVPADVWVFVNGSLESVNHLFLRELVRQAMQPECGLVRGKALDLRGRTLPTGSTWFFATRRSLLQQVGGLSMLHASAFQALFERLKQRLDASGGRLVDTDLAVATFEEFARLGDASDHG